MSAPPGRRDDEVQRADAPNRAGSEGPAEVDDPERRKLVTWLWRLPVLAALTGGAWGVYRGWQVHFVKPPAADPAFAPATPHRVASLADFDAAWTTTAFSFDGVPALAIRIPERVPGSIEAAPGLHLIGFSRICTHQGCIVDLNRSVEAIAIATNYRGEHPALFCGCHLSVFDPLAGGRAVAGPAQLPLARVQLETRADEVWAVGREQA